MSTHRSLIAKVLLFILLIAQIPLMPVKASAETAEDRAAIIHYAVSVEDRNVLVDVSSFNRAIAQGDSGLSAYLKDGKAFTTLNYYQVADKYVPVKEYNRIYRAQGQDPVATYNQAVSAGPNTVSTFYKLLSYGQQQADRPVLLPLKLDSLVREGQGYAGKANLYTPATWQSLQTELTAGLALQAKVLAAPGEVTQEEIDSSLTGLQEALDLMASKDFNIVGAENPAPITDAANGVPADSAALGLPEAVNTKLGDGTTVTTAVYWDLSGSGYDPSSEQEQTFIVNGALIPREPVTNTSGQTVNVQVTTAAASDGARRVESPSELPPIRGVKNGAEKSAFGLGLPENVNVQLNDGETASLPVTWAVYASSYDPSSPEAQTFTVNGTPVIKPGYTNPVNVSVELEVTVEAANGDLAVMSVSPIRALTERDNAAPKTVSGLGLPSEIELTLSDGSAARMAVRWNLSASGYAPYATDGRVYTFVGVPVLPEGVRNPDRIVANIDVEVNGITDMIVQAYQTDVVVDGRAPYTVTGTVYGAESGGILSLIFDGEGSSVVPSADLKLGSGGRTFEYTGLQPLSKQVTVEVRSADGQRIKSDNKTLVWSQPLADQQLSGLLGDLTAELGDNAAERYTPDTWSAYAAASDTAQAVQAEVGGSEYSREIAIRAMSAYDVLTAAADQLIALDQQAAKQKLAAYVNKYGILTETDLAPADWMPLQEALLGAQQVLDTDPATRKQIRDAETAFDLVLAAGLQDRAASLAGLLKLQDQLSKLDSSLFSPESWTVLRTALDEVKVRAQQELDRGELLDLLVRLYAANDQLELQLSGTALMSGAAFSLDHLPDSASRVEHIRYIQYELSAAAPLYRSDLASIRVTFDGAPSVPVEFGLTAAEVDGLTVTLDQASNRLSLSGIYVESSSVRIEYLNTKNVVVAQQDIDTALKPGGATQAQIKANLNALKAGLSPLASTGYGAAGWTKFQQALTALPGTSATTVNEADYIRGYAALLSAYMDLLPADSAAAQSELASALAQTNDVQEDEFSAAAWSELQAARAYAEKLQSAEGEVTAYAFAIAQRDLRQWIVNELNRTVDVETNLIYYADETQASITQAQRLAADASGKSIAELIEVTRQVKTLLAGIAKVNEADKAEAGYELGGERLNTYSIRIELPQDLKSGAIGASLTFEEAPLTPVTDAVYGSTAVSERLAGTPLANVQRAALRAGSADEIITLTFDREAGTVAYSGTNADSAHVQLQIYGEDGAIALSQPVNLIYGASAAAKALASDVSAAEEKMAGRIKADYTAGSWQAYQTALAQAKASTPSDSTDRVNRLGLALRDAVNSMERINQAAAKTTLIEKQAQAAAMRSELLNEQRRAAIADAQNYAQSVKDKQNAKQGELDRAERGMTNALPNAQQFDRAFVAGLIRDIQTKYPFLAERGSEYRTLQNILSGLKEEYARAAVNSANVLGLQEQLKQEMARFGYPTKTVKTELPYEAGGYPLTTYALIGTMPSAEGIVSARLVFNEAPLMPVRDTGGEDETTMKLNLETRMYSFSGTYADSSQARIQFLGSGGQVVAQQDIYFTNTYALAREALTYWIDRAQKNLWNYSATGFESQSWIKYNAALAAAIKDVETAESDRVAQLTVNLLQAYGALIPTNTTAFVTDLKAQIAIAQKVDPNAIGTDRAAALKSALDYAVQVSGNQRSTVLELTAALRELNNQLPVTADAPLTADTPNHADALNKTLKQAEAQYPQLVNRGEQTNVLNTLVNNAKTLAAGTPDQATVTNSVYAIRTEINRLDNLYGVPVTAQYTTLPFQTALTLADGQTVTETYGTYNIQGRLPKIAGIDSARLVFDAAPTEPLTSVWNSDDDARLTLDTAAGTYSYNGTFVDSAHAVLQVFDAQGKQLAQHDVFFAYGDSLLREAAEHWTTEIGSQLGKLSAAAYTTASWTRLQTALQNMNTRETQEKDLLQRNLIELRASFAALKTKA
ncbi:MULTISPECIES: Ig-like domain-containing protein [Saccharibacillus]|uniref:Ig-like domain-containing protein n=1 Tax=Saccharibacillus TaxID=456492 RepID=UPI001366097B|nr:Ig-like domain-containing protein [Saccharibacillus sp. WB 17]